MIGTVINYCTNDYRCLKDCIEEAKAFSSDIVVTVCDHFFNGEPENRNLLNVSYANHPDVRFVEYEYNSDRAYGISPHIKPTDKDWIHYWHSTGRYVGAHYLDENVDYVLFLDVDEIVEGKRFLQWLNSFPYQDYNAIFFACYFYFRKSIYRAQLITRNGLLINRSALEPELLLDVQERNGTFRSMEGAKLDKVLGSDGRPLVHHYSWVRTKEELKKKVCWGHHYETNWDEKIEHEFSRPFRGRDTIWDLEYDIVKPPHDPMKVKLPKGFVASTPEHFSNVTRVAAKDVFRQSVDSI